MRELLQIKNQSNHIFILIFFLFNCYANPLFAYHNFEEILDIEFFEIPLVIQEVNSLYVNSEIDSTEIYKALAFDYAKSGDAETSVQFINKYIRNTADLSILNDHLFNTIKNDASYLAIKDRFNTKITLLSVIYFYAGFFGFFIFLVLNFKKKTDKMATILISLFILFHSIFILHLSLYIINYQYKFPHLLYISTTFSFLYGPLLYFYFKRITYDYKFKLSDSLHLVPSVLLLIYLMPYYAMPEMQKFQMMYDQESIPLRSTNIIFVVKTISLLLYAFLTIKIYRKNFAALSAKMQLNNKLRNKIVWQRNIILIYIAYIVTYIIYAFIITQIINFPSLIHLQIVVMVSLVFYVAFISYAQPEIFKGKIRLMDPGDFFKYKNSGLTESYSQELRDKLLVLLEQEKIYKQNDISLGKLSERLDTTRHNTSQVINEHFNMNFFDLINKYRITEALEILKNDTNNNLNIIEVAYEVGFNNKVTFNKSFKKHLSQTPSQYLVSLRA